MLRFFGASHPEPCCILNLEKNPRNPKGDSLSSWKKLSRWIGVSLSVCLFVVVIFVLFLAVLQGFRGLNLDHRGKSPGS